MPMSSAIMTTIRMRTLVGGREDFLVGMLAGKDFGYSVAGLRVEGEEGECQARNAWEGGN
jgi:hypothetical protein